MPQDRSDERTVRASIENNGEEIKHLSLYRRAKAIRQGGDLYYLDRSVGDDIFQGVISSLLRLEASIS